MSIDNIVIRWHVWINPHNVGNKRGGRMLEASKEVLITNNSFLCHLEMVQQIICDSNIYDLQVVSDTVWTKGGNVIVACRQNILLNDTTVFSHHHLDCYGKNDDHHWNNCQVFIIYFLNQIMYCWSIDAAPLCSLIYVFIFLQYFVRCDIFHKYEVKLILIGFYCTVTLASMSDSLLYYEWATFFFTAHVPQHKLQQLWHYLTPLFQNTACLNLNHDPSASTVGTDCLPAVL